MLRGVAARLALRACHARMHAASAANDSPSLEARQHSRVVSAQLVLSWLEARGAVRSPHVEWMTSETSLAPSARGWRRKAGPWQVAAAAAELGPPEELAHRVRSRARERASAAERGSR